MRLDAKLVSLNIARSRELAKKYVKEGNVLVNGKTVLKPSYDVNENDEMKFTGDEEKYVGRGGLKLEYAIEKFGISVRDKLCLDIGASTGGFTDCLLQYGAKCVYAVDVGSNQLSQKLINNRKVINIEKTDIRDFSNKYNDVIFDFICTDVSFISLKNITESALKLIKKDGEIVFLIKPQFEVGIKNIGKNGIVKDKKIHKKLLNEMICYFRSFDLNIINIEKSPIKGGSGNTEYLIYMKPEYKEHQQKAFNIKEIVDH